MGRFVERVVWNLQNAVVSSLSAVIRLMIRRSVVFTENLCGRPHGRTGRRCCARLPVGNLDTFLKRSDEISGYIDMPLLVTIPALVTRGSVLEHRRAQRLLMLASIGALAVGVVCVRIFTSMYF